MAQKASRQYMEQTLLTAAPADLLNMLMNEELKSIKIAIICIKKKSLAEAHNRLIKAQNIIDELLCSLNSDYKISEDLAAIYRFIKQQLISANIHKDIQKLEELIPIVTELCDAWKQASRIVCGIGADLNAGG